LLDLPIFLDRRKYFPYFPGNSFFIIMEGIMKEAREENNLEKKAYSKPILTRQGKLKDLTAGRPGSIKIGD